MIKISQILIIICLSTLSTSLPDNELDTQKVLQVVNEYRQKGCNCTGKKMPPVKPLQWNTALEKYALDHSKKQYQKARMHHSFINTSASYKAFYIRLQKAGYEGICKGENVAATEGDERQLIELWLHSQSGHCEAIMQKNIAEIGVAKVGNYSTLLVGKP